MTRVPNRGLFIHRLSVRAIVKNQAPSLVFKFNSVLSLDLAATFPAEFGDASVLEAAGPAAVARLTCEDQGEDRGYDDPK